MALLSGDKETGAGGAPGSPSDMRYQAFLSYSHQDSDQANWLHKAIERFAVPRSLVGRITATGAVPRSLAPIFRDRHELAASSDLGQTIRAALKQSRFLIVLCSPAAAASHWVNEEIATFKKLHGDQKVLAAIVAGEPWASELAGREAEECFPPALREKYDRRGRSTGKRAEPIAADLREAEAGKVGGDGREAAKLKLVAGMLGLGLDELVQREQQRRQKRLTYIAAASIAGMTATSGLALFAFDKRDEARDQRREAEGLVGFMLGDLRKQLEPIQRLDALDAVGARALAYFEKQDKSELSDAAIAQRSRALTMMGEIASTRGDLDGALLRYREAWAGTAEALRRQPNDTQRIFDHAQNVFWVGQIDWQRGRMAQAEKAMREYKSLAERLIAADPAKKEWQLEGVYSDSNLSALLVELGRYGEATESLRAALGRRESLVASDPRNPAYQKAFSEGLAWLSEALEKSGRLEDGLAQRERQIAFLERLIREPRSDIDHKRSQMVALRVAGRLLASRGDVNPAVTYLTRSVAIGDELMRIEPDNANWAGLAAASNADLGELQLDTGKIDQAGASARIACDITNRLIARDSSVEDWRLDRQSQCLALRIRLALAHNRTDEALASARTLQQLAQTEAAKGITYDKRAILILASSLRGIAEQRAGNSAAARAAYVEGLGYWQETRPQTPLIAARLALIQLGLGRQAKADEQQRKLDSMGYRHPTYLRERALIRSR